MAVRKIDKAEIDFSKIYGTSYDAMHQDNNTVNVNQDLWGDFDELEFNEETGLVTENGVGLGFINQNDLISINKATGSVYSPGNPESPTVRDANANDPSIGKDNSNDKKNNNDGFAPGNPESPTVRDANAKDPSIGNGVVAPNTESSIFKNKNVLDSSYSTEESSVFKNQNIFNSSNDEINENNATPKESTSENGIKAIEKVNNNETVSSNNVTSVSENNVVSGNEIKNDESVSANNVATEMSFEEDTELDSNEKLYDEEPSIIPIDKDDETIAIPESLNQSGISKNYTNYKYFYGKWNDGTKQSKLSKMWGDAGKTSDRGIATLNGRYLMAVSPQFGSVGDHIDVCLDDGTIIKGTIGDIKGSDKQSYWGHMLGNGVDVIEWESMGNQKVIQTDEWHGHDVVSITNKGDNELENNL